MIYSLVMFALTPMDRTLLERVRPRMEWARAHTASIAAARAGRDARPAPSLA